MKNGLFCGEFNDHIGLDNISFESLHSRYGFGQRNKVETSILEFTLTLMYLEGLFQEKKETFDLTFKSETLKEIAFFMLKKNDSFFCKNCKVIPCKPIATQHQLLTLNILFKERNNHKILKVEPIIKW